MNNFPYELEIDEYYDSDLEDIINSCKSGYIISNISSEYIRKKDKPPSALELKNYNRHLEKIKEEKEREAYFRLNEQKEKKKSQKELEELEEFYKTPAYAKLISDYLEFHRKNKIGQFSNGEAVFSKAI